MRYEIIDKIAQGDFASVYRARDRELGREVAVKQIHKQFLADGRQLARYWQEAQLLASLQHPNILTIYDIVRPKGWLVLELMQGSLQPATESEGIDLDYLRNALAESLRALDFLHGNGIVHGDIKPSNLLVDAQGRVKLGDFGLARRASNEEGSLLKGTTKYMAPELVSDRFGEAGPVADLYSLGFAAYELMCGKNFETLFPGLGSMGRDRQIAWMMWHAAPDRNLPPVGRVLEGVPPDLTRVIEHLIAKDQSKRCKSAKEALWELRTDPARDDGGPSEAEIAAEAARSAAAKKKRLMRLAAVASMAVSAVVCILMLMPPKQKQQPPGPPPPKQGVVKRVYHEEHLLDVLLDAREGQKAEEIEEINVTGNDRFFINGQPHVLRDFKPGDHVTIETLVENGRRIKEIRAYRPEVGRGLVKSVDAAQRRFTVALEEADGKTIELNLAAPDGLKIAFNGSDVIDGRPFALSDLQPDDRIVVRHEEGESGREAVELSVERVVKADGVVRKLDPDRGELTISTGPDDAATVTIPFADKCEITINDRRFINDKLLEPGDLRVGDVVTVFHDTRAVRIAANRVLGQEGVIRAVHYDAGTIDVVGEGGKPTTYSIGSECKITLGGDEVKLADLRKGDVAEVTHEMPDARRPEAVAVAARRPADRSRWALLIGNENFEDRSVTRPAQALNDANLLRDSLVARYKVPADQAFALADESLVRLEQSIPDYLGRVGGDDDLLVYITGRAYRNGEGKVFIAPRAFDLNRMDVTGLPLQWLIGQLEQCKAKRKLLLLDLGRAGEGSDLAREPASAEMLETLDAPPGRAPLRTVTAIAAGKSGRASLDASGGRGLFAAAASLAYSGSADKNRDLRLEPTELFGFLQDRIAESSSQTPVLFLPDNRPPRLSDQAKTAIRRLAAAVDRKKLDLDTVRDDYRDARQAAGKEIEPRLLYALILMKQKHYDAAAKQFDELRLQRPELPLPPAAVAWMRFEQRAYQAGIKELADLAAMIPRPNAPPAPFSQDTSQLIEWIGRLREYAAESPEELRRPSTVSLAALDDAIAKIGPEAKQHYEQGRAKSRAFAADFDKRIAAATSNADSAKLKIERRRIVHYVDFPYDEIVRIIIAGLDQ